MSPRRASTPSRTTHPFVEAGRRRAYDLGRRAEAMEGTRRRIAEAAYQLFLDHSYDDVTLNDIAKAAGVSHQTVLNHYESKGGVIVGVTEVAAEHVEDLSSGAVPGDVASIVRTTCERYEQMGDSNARWEAVAARVPEVGVALDAAREGFQGWLVEMFSDDLPHDAGDRERAVLGLHAALHLFTWKLFRRDLALSRARTELQMTDLVLGVLAQHRS